MKFKSLGQAIAVIVCSLVVTSVSPGSARAGVLWDNGTYDNTDSLTNGSNLAYYAGGTSILAYSSQVYDDFIVPTGGDSWLIQSVFSDNQILFLTSSGGTTVPTSAVWSIRTGVSAGNGGTVVASGTATATATALPEVPGYYYAQTPYRITANITQNLILAPGTYWLSVAPVDPNGYLEDATYIETTSGAGSVGQPAGNDGLSYVTNTLPTAEGGMNFVPTTVALAGDGDGPTIDFAMGINGIAVPEPSTVSMAAIAALAGAGWLVRRKRLAPGS